MEANYKVLIKNTTNHPVMVILQDAKFQREWTAGASLKVPFSILEEGIFDKGFRFFLEKGVLFIEDKAVRVELGLEEEDGPPIFKVLNKSQMLKLLKVDSLEDFEKTFEDLSRDQRNSIIDLALEEKIVNIDKINIIKKYTGIDLLKAIQLNAEEG